MPTVRIDDNSSDDSQSGETKEVTSAELSALAAQPGNELIVGDPAAESGTNEADFTIFSTGK